MHDHICIYERFIKMIVNLIGMQKFCKDVQAMTISYKMIPTSSEVGVNIFGGRFIFCETVLFILLIFSGM